MEVTADKQTTHWAILGEILGGKENKRSGDQFGDAIQGLLRN